MSQTGGQIPEEFLPAGQVKQKHGNGSLCCGVYVARKLLNNHCVHPQGQALRAAADGIKGYAASSACRVVVFRIWWVRPKVLLVRVTNPKRNMNGAEDFMASREGWE